MADYFFDALSGNDANSGLTTGAPKQSLSALIALILAGNRLYMARGTRWTVTGANAMLMSSKTVDKTGCIIDAYDIAGRAATKPLIDCLTYETSSDDASWTALGDGRWQKTFASAPDTMWSGITQSSVLDSNSFGQQFGHVATAAAATSNLKWNVNGSVVTVYTGSAAAPPSFYSGIAYNRSGIGSGGGVELRNCTNVFINNLRVYGGAQQFVFSVLSNNTVAGCEVTDCEAYLGNRAVIGAFRINSPSGLTNIVVRDLVFRRPFWHSGLSLSGKEGQSTTGPWASHNGINCGGYCENVRVIDPVGRGGNRHTCLQAATDGTTTLAITQGLQIYRTRPDMGIIDCNGDEVGTGHPMDICANGFHVDGITFLRPAGAAQIGGYGKLTRLDFGAFVTNTEDSGAFVAGLNGAETSNSYINLQNWDTPDYRSIDDITISGCIFRQQVGWVCAVQYTPAIVNLVANGAIKFINNTVIDLVQPSGRTAIHRSWTPGSAWATVPNWFHQNNLYITNLTDIIRIETANGVHTQYTLNNATPITDNTNQAYSSASSARINGTLLPRPTSISAAYRAGVYTGPRVGLDGRQMWMPPSIGALEAA